MCRSWQWIYFDAFFGFTGAAGAAIWGVGRGGGQIAWSIGVLKFAPASKEANYLGLHTFLTGVRGAIAPFIAISFLDLGLSPEKLFLTASVLIILSAYLNYKFVRSLVTLYFLGTQGCKIKDTPFR